MDSPVDFVTSRRPPAWTLLLLFLLDLLLTSEQCSVGKPQVDPLALLVSYGGPAQATCSTRFHVDLIAWEGTVGGKTESHKQQLAWSVPRVTDWSLRGGMKCFTTSEEHGQCETHLPITIYKIPDKVSLSLVYPPAPAPLIEHRLFTLYCEVHNLAPLSGLSIVWYRGGQEIDIAARAASLPLMTTEGNPDEVATAKLRVDLNVSRDDHEVDIQCAARLQLNTTQNIPETLSGNSINRVVYWKPRVVNASGDVVLRAHNRLALMCQGEAYPEPSYQWSHQGVDLDGENNMTLVIEAVNGSHAGVYECLLSNAVGHAAVTMRVTVEDELEVEEDSSSPSLLTALLVALILAILGAAGGVFYLVYRRKTKTDSYQVQNQNQKVKLTAIRNS
ncbi:uncharacterized protein LOC134459879 [Engraulis encrasicolus]|uniref:uncharacterized protein LOC134459879 n=1 Tax=Engraulis encrasicolus TaxID=184585 RepID=UPI002FD1DACD